MAPLLSVRDVTLRFGGILALDEVSLAVEQGTISGLIGPNGAGKTTTFNVITRLYTPDSGSLELDGVSLLSTRPHDVVGRGIARTFQNINLFRTMTVLENVVLPAMIAGTKRKQAETRARDLLDLLGLGDKAGEVPAVLSGGQRQRLAIARALAVDPPMLLMDEPTASLDPERREELGTLLQQLLEQRRTLVVATHDEEFARRFATRIVRMEQGVVTEAK